MPQLKVRDVIRAVEALAPPGLAYSWDRIGLHTGRPDADTAHAFVTLSVTNESVAAACGAGADLIVSHHPLIWEPLKDLRDDNPVARLCLDVARAKIACFAAHTNLDVTPGGVNDVLAQRIGLKTVSPLLRVPHAELLKLITFVPRDSLAKVREAVCNAGAGVIGDYRYCSFSAPGTGTFLPDESSSPVVGLKGKVNEEPELRFEVLVPKARSGAIISALVDAHPYEEVAYDLVRLEGNDSTISLGLRGTLDKPMPLGEFAKLTRKQLEVQHVRVVGDLADPVQRVAVMGGAGGGSIEHVPNDVDVFVTGDVKYHEAQLALERGLAVIDAGHHGTEKWIVPALANYLRAECEGLQVTEFVERDPFCVV